MAAIKTITKGYFHSQVAILFSDTSTVTSHTYGWWWNRCIRRTDTYQSSPSIWCVSIELYFLFLFSITRSCGETVNTVSSFISSFRIHPTVFDMSFLSVSIAITFQYWKPTCQFIQMVKLPGSIGCNFWIAIWIINNKFFSSGYRYTWLKCRVASNTYKYMWIRFDKWSTHKNKTFLSAKLCMIEFQSVLFLSFLHFQKRK